MAVWERGLAHPSLPLSRHDANACSGPALERGHGVSQPWACPRCPLGSRRGRSSGGPGRAAGGGRAPAVAARRAPPARSPAPPGSGPMSARPPPRRPMRGRRRGGRCRPAGGRRALRSAGLRGRSVPRSLQPRAGASRAVRPCCLLPIWRSISPASSCPLPAPPRRRGTSTAERQAQRRRHHHGGGGRGAAGLPERQD